MKNSTKTTLGKVIKLEYGKPLPKADRSPAGKYPVYGANGEKTRSDKFYYDKPSIIVGRKGSAGEVTLTHEKFWPLDVTYFVKFDDKKIDRYFLYTLLKNLDLPRLAIGIKPGINREEVYSLPVDIPPIEEQIKISSYLQLIDKSLDQTTQKKIKLQRIKQALTQDLLSKKTNI